MIINPDPSRSTFRDAWRRLSPWKAVLVASLAVSGTATVAVLVARTPAVRTHIKQWGEERGYDPRSSFKEQIVKMPGRWFASLVEAEQVPSLSVDVKFKNVERLRAQKSAALALGFLVQGEDDYVPGTMTHEGNQASIRLRMKGDFTTDINDDKWAFRIHTRGEDYVLGMKRFSLHHPQARRYESEPLFYMALRREGILTPRYFFADVDLNGDPLGRMAVEEHFSKELLESQGRRESVIVRYDEGPFWQNVIAMSSDSRERCCIGYHNSAILPFRANYVARSEGLSSDLAVATGLLRAFASGRISASEAFDPDLLGRFLAISEAWGAWHGLIWHNSRFYYNPFSARLEPIAFDGMPKDRYSARFLLERRDPVVTAMLSDSLVARSYAAALSKLGQELEDSGVLMDSLRSKQGAIMNVLHGQYPLREPYKLETIAVRSRQLSDMHARRSGQTDVRSQEQATAILEGPLRLVAYRIEGTQPPSLELASRVPQTISVVDIYWADSSGTKIEPLRNVSGEQFALPLALNASDPDGSPLQYRRLPFSESREPGLILTVSIDDTAGAGPHVVEVVRSFPELDRNPSPAADLTEVLDRHAFLESDADSAWLMVRQGHWDVGQDLVIPEGVGLRIGPGTTLRFESDALLVARGPTHFEGTRESPIILTGPDGPTGSATWQGVVVLQAGEPSRWSHVSVRNTAGIDAHRWRLTGGVTFYESEVVIEHCTFVGNVAEDALNLFQSGFRLTGITISDAISDGLDIDFSDGDVDRGTFKDIGWIGGGDALDVSGSTVSVVGTTFARVGDKAISVGEGSDVSVSGVSVSNASVGLASKDRSLVSLKSSHLADISHAGLMAYTKKAEYGPAALLVEDVSMERVARDDVVQTGSVIIRDGVRRPTIHVDVDSLYETSMKPGLRK